MTNKNDEMYNVDSFIDEALTLIEAHLRQHDSMAASVLFGDEVAASDWLPQDAVDALFKYASRYGWGE